MANHVDPDQTAPSGAVWSGSTLFAYAISSKYLMDKILRIYRTCIYITTFILNIQTNMPEQ